MEDLKEFLDDIRRIRIAVEKMANLDNGVDKSSQLNMPNPYQVAEPVQQVVQTPTQIPVQVPVAPIPTTSESFTQDQIAVAMSNAVAAGRNDIIQNILATFNAQCLMQIDTANYNQIAAMLREAGIQV